MSELRSVPPLGEEPNSDPQDKPGSPLLRYFGSELRRLREQAGLTQEELSGRINYSKSKVSKVETGKSSPLEPTQDDELNSPFTAKCDEVLESDLRLTRILPLLVDADKAYPSWFQPYPSLEAAAREIYSFQPQVIPGLLQTEDYARALLRSNYPPISDIELEGQVQARIRRQEILERELPPLSWFVLDEAVVRRSVGDPEVFGAQLDRLIATRDNRWITLQVLPFARGPHALMSGSMVILQLPQDRVLYVESQGGAHISGMEKDVGDSIHGFYATCGRALSPDESLQLIAEIRGTLCR